MIWENLRQLRYVFEERFPCRCQIVGWGAPAVRNLVKALKHAGGSKRLFPRFIMRGTATAILKHEGHDGESGLLAILSYLFCDSGSFR